MNEKKKKYLKNFSMTIFSHDYYMIRLPLIENVEYSFLGYDNILDYRERKIIIAPIIRLYGTYISGQKACLHIHGVKYNKNKNLIIIYCLFSIFLIFMLKLKILNHY